MLANDDSAFAGLLASIQKTPQKLMQLDGILDGGRVDDLLISGIISKLATKLGLP